MRCCWFWHNQRGGKPSFAAPGESSMTLQTATCSSTTGWTAPLDVESREILVVRFRYTR